MGSSSVGLQGARHGDATGMRHRPSGTPAIPHAAPPPVPWALGTRVHPARHGGIVGTSRGTGGRRHEQWGGRRPYDRRAKARGGRSEREDKGEGEGGREKIYSRGGANRLAGREKRGPHMDTDLTLNHHVVRYIYIAKLYFPGSTEFPPCPLYICSCGLQEKSHLRLRDNCSKHARYAARVVRTRAHAFQLTRNGGRATCTARSSQGLSVSQGHSQPVRRRSRAGFSSAARAGSPTPQLTLGGLV
jgi:hypothetical protein